MSALKDALIDRIAKLQDRRQDLAARAKAQVSDLDAQIAAAQALVANWDTLTIEQALVALTAAGIRPRFES